MKKRIIFAAAAVIAISALNSVRAQNTANNYIGTAAGNAATGTNWSLGHVPLINEDAVFNSSSATGIKSLSGVNASVGSIDVTATSGTYSLRNNTASTTASITLGGAGDLGNSVSGTAADLLYAAAGGTLQLLTGAGTLNVVLGQSGNFNAAGTINIATVVSGAFAVTKTGAGTLAMQGANTFGGGLTLSNGTLSIENGGSGGTSSSLGTGTFTINGGTITNASAAAVTISTNNAQVWAGDFSFAGTSSTSSLNLGSGAVTLTGNRAINISGTTSTLTVNGSIAGNGFSLTKGGPGLGVLILGGANTYTGGTLIAAGTLIANSDGAFGPGNVSLTAASVTLTLQSGATNNYIANNANLSIGFVSDTINLNFVGTDVIGSLTLAGVPQAPGIYGGAASGAPNVLPEFIGTGTLTVLVPEPSTYILIGLGALICAQQYRRRKSA